MTLPRGMRRAMAYTASHALTRAPCTSPCTRTRPAGMMRLRIFMTNLNPPRHSVGQEVVERIETLAKLSYKLCQTEDQAFQANAKQRNQFPTLAGGMALSET